MHPYKCHPWQSASFGGVSIMNRCMKWNKKVYHNYLKQVDIFRCAIGPGTRFINAMNKTRVGFQSRANDYNYLEMGYNYSSLLIWTGVY